MNQQIPLTDNIFVSVIIPVYNNVEGLKLCLEALNNQTYARHLLEIIVVDNDSDNSETIEEVTKQYDRVTYSQEKKIGSYAARNKGISIAKGEIIAFTDADCIPNYDWLETGVAKLSSIANCGLVAGKIEVFFPNSQPKTAIALYEYVIGFPQQQALEKEHYGVTANLFTWKKVIDQVGLFDSNLKSCGDVEWGQRVYANGYKQIYAEDTCVAHPARYSFPQLYKKTIRVAGGIYDLCSSNRYSKIKTSQLLVKSIIANLIPPVNFALNSWHDYRLNSFFSKIKVVAVLYLRRLIIVMELCQLITGKASARE